MHTYYCNCHFFLENSISTLWLAIIYKYVSRDLVVCFFKISKLNCIHEMKSWSIKNYVKHQTASKNCKCLIKVMFFKNTTKLPNLHCRFDIMYYISVKLTLKIWSIFVAFLVNTNFNVLILKHFIYLKINIWWPQICFCWLCTFHVGSVKSNFEKQTCIKEVWKRKLIRYHGVKLAVDDISKWWQNFAPLQIDLLSGWHGVNQTLFRH